MQSDGLSVPLDVVLDKTNRRWFEAERQRVLLEAKLEEVLAENEKLKQQIEEMISAQRIKEHLADARSVRETPGDALAEANGSSK